MADELQMDNGLYTLQCSDSLPTKGVEFPTNVTVNKIMANEEQNL
jgi:hypothetical protein